MQSSKHLIRTIIPVQIQSSLTAIFGYVAAITLTIILSSCSSPEDPTIVWQPYSPVLLEDARLQQRPVLLDFYADWCGPCREYDKYIFKSPEVIEAIHSFVTLRVDVTDYESLEEGGLSMTTAAVRNRFQLVGFPTIIIINRDGKEIREARINGLLDSEEFVTHLKKWVED